MLMWRKMRMMANGGESKQQWLKYLQKDCWADWRHKQLWHSWTSAPPPASSGTMASDVCERGGGDETHSERAWEVVVLPVALVAEVEGVLLLPLVGVAEQNHLTQKSVHDHVPVVDLGVGVAQPKMRKRRRKDKSSQWRDPSSVSHTLTNLHSHRLEMSHKYNITFRRWILQLDLTLDFANS